MDPDLLKVKSFVKPKNMFANLKELGVSTEKRRETLDTTTPASIEMVVTKISNSTTIVNLTSYNYL